MVRRLRSLFLIAIAACGGTAASSGSEPLAPVVTETTDLGTGRIEVQSPPLSWSLPPAELCQSYGPPVGIATVQDDRLREVSGIVRSRRFEGITWMHNDSGDGAVLYAVNAEGRTIAAFNLGVLTLDPEDLAIAPGPGEGDYLYFADIGDNFAIRPIVSLYRVPEPDPNLSTIGLVERIDLIYPDGPVDAEALFIDPVTGGVVVITKVDDQPATVLWGSGSDLMNGGPVRLDPIARLDLGGSVTGADISASGDRIVMRGYEHVWMWGRVSLDLGEVFAQPPCELEGPEERQGEAIGFGPDGALYTVSEGRNPAIFELPYG